MHSTRSGHVYSHQNLRGRTPYRGDEEDDSDSGNDSAVYYESEEDDANAEYQRPMEVGTTLLAVDHGKTFQLDDGQYYAFSLGMAEVRAPLSIRFHQTQEECSLCGTTSCSHIAWLKGQLGVANGQDSYSYLWNRSMPRVCHERGWEFVDQFDQECEPALWRLKNERQRRNETPLSRMKAVRDIMSTFDRYVVADEYRPDIFNLAVHTDDVLSPNDLEATLSRLLLKDDAIFNQFDQLVPRGRRDFEFLRKMESKFSETLRQLDEYEATGNLSQWTAMGPDYGVAFPHNVPWCGRTLIEIVDSIRDNLQWRDGMSLQHQTMAADILISMLEDVLLRNTELYQNITWIRHAPRHEPSSHRNLYLNLLSLQANDGGGFILEALESLPDDFGMQGFQIDRLVEAKQKLGPRGSAAPRQYVNRLNLLIEKFRRISEPAFAPVSSSIMGSAIPSLSSVGEPSSMLPVRPDSSSLAGPSSSRTATVGEMRSSLGKRTARSASSTDREGKRAMK